MFDILDPNDRLRIIKEINGEENEERKRQSQVDFEIYRKQQRKYILNKLLEEYATDTVKNMRKVTSINLTEKIINKKASIYNEEPTRIFMDASEREEEQLALLYKKAHVNINMKQANRMFKLHMQSAIWTFPKDGIINMQVLQPHQYDVIPDPKQPSKALAYIVNIYNKQDNDDEIFNPRFDYRDTLDDQINQKIGDPDDYKSKLKRMAWWTAEYQFVTDGRGVLIDPETNMPYKDSFVLEEELINPLGRLPFIDIAPFLKDSEFFIKSGSNVSGFNLDLGVILSDVAESDRMDNRPMTVLTAREAPQNLTIGPQRVLFLPQSPEDGGKDPNIQVISPNANTDSSINFVNALVNLFLSGEDMPANTITTDSSGDDDATSGLDRLLMMIERFEASQDDFDIFKMAEEELFTQLRDWSNVMQDVTGEMALIPELQGVVISDDVKFAVKFNKPAAAITEEEKLALYEKKLDLGIINEKIILMESEGFSEEEAEIRLQEIRGQSLDTEQDTEGNNLHMHASPDGGFTAPAADSPNHTHELSDGSVTGPPIQSEGGGPHFHELSDGQETSPAEGL